MELRELRAAAAELPLYRRSSGGGRRTGRGGSTRSTWPAAWRNWRRMTPIADAEEIRRRSSAPLKPTGRTPTPTLRRRRRRRRRPEWRWSTTARQLGCTWLSSSTTTWGAARAVESRWGSRAQIASKRAWSIEESSLAARANYELSRTRSAMVLRTPLLTLRERVWAQVLRICVAAPASFQSRRRGSARARRMSASSGSTPRRGGPTRRARRASPRCRRGSRWRPSAARRAATPRRSTCRRGGDAAFGPRSKTARSRGRPKRRTAAPRPPSTCPP